MALTFQTLFSGSSGNSAYVTDGRTHILIDSGMGIRKMEAAFSCCGINPSELDAILLTHEHIDHIRSADALSGKYDIPIFATHGTWRALEGGNPLKAALKNRIAFDRECDFYMGDFNIQPFGIPHDAAEPCGYCLVNKGKKIVIATDMGHTNDDFISRVKDANLILLESNYDSTMLRDCPYPPMLKRRIAGRTGHLSNGDCAKTLRQIAGFGILREIILGHLSVNSNTPQLALDESAAALSEIGGRLGRDMRLSVAGRDEAGKPVTL